MGRELRRVPAGWEHPKNWRGHFQPMHDRDYIEEADEWRDGFLKWELGTHPDIQQDPSLAEKFRYFWEWHGSPPDRTYYRPEWDAEQMTHYQVYENVTEGTPVSPVFASTDEVVVWLVEQGYTESAARAFVGFGYAPSGVLVTGGGDEMYAIGIASLDLLQEKP